LFFVLCSLFFVLGSWVLGLRPWFKLQRPKT
jgi:hypothetical protein